MLSRIVSSRQTRRNDGYVAANTSVTNDGAALDDVFAQSADDLESNKMSLPPRYRFRDLLLGDFAFTDDGQRWVTSNYVTIVISFYVIATCCGIQHNATVCTNSQLRHVFPLGALLKPGTSPADVGIKQVFIW